MGKMVKELAQRIWELKNESQIRNVKSEIQRLQQLMDSADTSNKNNSANKK